MKKIIPWVASFLIALALSGCSRMLEVAADGPSVEFARETIRAAAKGDFGNVKSRVADGPKDEHFEEKLRGLYAQYRTEPSEIDLVRFTSRASTKNKGDAQYGYDFDSLHGDQHVLTHVTVIASAGTLKIAEVTARARADSAPATWTPSHYLCAGVAIVDLGIVGFALVRWFRTRRQLSRRWVWLAAILLGVGGVVFNWSTGQIDSVTLTRLLGFSTGLTRTPEGPWTLEVALPLGAIIFLLRIPGRFAVREASPASP